MEKNLDEKLKQAPSNLIKIALFGPESTGKTTLSKQLANHYQTEWIPEFARDYLQEKWNKTHKSCEPNDLLPIAIGQMELENLATQKAQKIVFSDTNLLLTKTYSEIYYGYCEAYIEKYALLHQYDLYFLTYIDVPWEKDDLRDKPLEREEMFQAFKDVLDTYKKPYILIKGTQEERFSKTTKIIDEFIKAKSLGFSGYDMVQCYNRNIAIQTIENQLKYFKTGISKTELLKPATLNDGILQFSELEKDTFIRLFEKNLSEKRIQKFVPASGAATRMFKFLSEFINDFNPKQSTINAYINQKKCLELSVFLTGLKNFPFYDDLVAKTQQLYPDFQLFESDFQQYWMIKTLLGTDGFDYANKPKAVLPFHSVTNKKRTPIEEHLSEATFYTNHQPALEFTISVEHKILFEPFIDNQSVTISYQSSATDTLAVTPDNRPFRDEQTNLVFRPAGHGALLHNLSQLDAELIFIKNIDNVSHKNLNEITKHKKYLGGILIHYQTQIFNYLTILEDKNISENELEIILNFAQNELNIPFSKDILKYKKEFIQTELYNKLNRPIRVCGMVKNEGEPGGGPFWVIDENEISLQIVETSQVDLAESDQKIILQQATHFNPVDLVCGIYNYKSKKFDLQQFINPNTGFIVEKNHNGKPLKAYELPGLWNGAMAHWTSLFVEVPLTTFSPVKTINDLLKPAHQ